MSNLPKNRRTFLKSAAMVGGSTMLGINQASGFHFFGGSTDLDIESLPEEWVVKQGEGVIRSYARRLAQIRMRNITVHQVIKAHARRKGKVWNLIPPEEMWNYMVPTLRVADIMVEAIGRPLIMVTSAYRSPVYNSLCPGAATNSFHKKNIALDLIYDERPSHVADVARELRHRGLFKGGVGHYSDFTHVDTRGYNTDW